jgi:hypothetical protein
VSLKRRRGGSYGVNPSGEGRIVRRGRRKRSLSPSRTEEEDDRGRGTRARWVGPARIGPRRRGNFGLLAAC